MDATPEARRVPPQLAGWCGPRSASRARRSTACDTPAPRSARLWPNFEPAFGHPTPNMAMRHQHVAADRDAQLASACRGWPPARTGALHTDLVAGYS